MGEEAAAVLPNSDANKMDPSRDGGSISLFNSRNNLGRGGSLNSFDIGALSEPVLSLILDFAGVVFKLVVLHFDHVSVILSPIILNAFNYFSFNFSFVVCSDLLLLVALSLCFSLVILAILSVLVSFYNYFNYVVTSLLPVLLIILVLLTIISFSFSAAY